MTLSGPLGLHLNNLSEISSFWDVYFCIYHKSIKLFSYLTFLCRPLYYEAYKCIAVSWVASVTSLTIASLEALYSSGFTWHEHSDKDLYLFWTFPFISTKDSYFSRSLKEQPLSVSRPGACMVRGWDMCVSCLPCRFLLTVTIALVLLSDAIFIMQHSWHLLLANLSECSSLDVLWSTTRLLHVFFSDVSQWIFSLCIDRTM